MIIHVMKDYRFASDYNWWDAMDENDRCVGTEERLAVFRLHSKTGKLHRGVHPDGKYSSTINCYKDIDGVSIYWYERVKI